MRDWLRPLLTAAALILTATVSHAEPLRVCLLSGSEEYESDKTLEVLRKHLESSGDVTCVLLKAQGTDKLPGLDALANCDLAVFFTRRLTIDGEDLRKIKAFCEAGKPIVGIRTASHGFQKWLEFDALYLGGGYKNHYGKTKAVETRPSSRNAARHPVLRDVKPIRSVASLYRNQTLAPDCVALLDGDNGEAVHPVAWVREKDGKQRIFYTSLGGQEDFQNPDFLRLLTNAVAWAADRPLTAQPRAGAGPMNPKAADIHSYSQPDQARVKHLALDLTVDFAAKALKGSVVLDVERKGKADAPLILDTRGLKIHRASSPRTGRDVPHRLGEADKILGAPLTIDLPAGETQVRVDYETAPTAAALQWLDGPRTASGKPFLFSQSQAIQARTWIPSQDSPGVRATYEATIRAPEGLRAVMSADQLPSDKAGVYRFKMPIAIPSYLIALAVGELEFRELGPRSGVYAEKPVVEKAAAEFADIEPMIAAIEKRYGPYRWGRYDVLVLPASFPFGGMENPKLTFATPTIIAGDKSLVSLIIHELAHSWSGNLVTNATWQDFWLNEGFTVYLERRILEAIYGKDRADMEAVIGMQTLRDDLAKLPPADRALRLDLKGRDPDDGVTHIAYEKGALLLETIERAVGRERFDAFLKGYFDRHAFQSVTSETLLDDLRQHLWKDDPRAAEAVRWDAWLHQPGLPEGHAEFQSARLKAVDQQVQDWRSGQPPNQSFKTRDWTTHEWVHMLDRLPKDLTNDQARALDQALKLTESENCEIAQRWLALGIRANYKPAIDRAERFLTTIGRRKCLMPLYEAFVESKSPEVRERGEAIFRNAKPFYHAISAESVEKLFSKK